MKPQSKQINYHNCFDENNAALAWNSTDDETSYEIFLIAVQNFRLPSRVRSDQGLENMLVARHMIEIGK